MAIPAFSLASRSTRLRTATRTVVAAHRYARGMAVLRQADMVLLLDERSGRIQVVQVEQSTPSGETNTASSANPYAHREADFYLSRASEAARVPTNIISAELTRDLPRDIRFEQIQADPMQRYESTWWIDYLPNGMCDPFEVVLSDGHGRRMVIRVDGRTGRAEVLEGEG